jgi:hypothetical protein
MALLHQSWDATTSCDTMPDVAATGIGRSYLRRLNPSGRWTAGSELAQGDGPAAYVTLETSSARGMRDRLRGASPPATGCP